MIRHIAPISHFLTDSLCHLNINFHYNTTGFMRQRLGSSAAPEVGESWRTVFDDIESVIMDGMTHWHAPGFFAYFSTAVNYPAMLASLLADATACIGFTWVCQTY